LLALESFPGDPDNEAVAKTLALARDGRDNITKDFRGASTFYYPLQGLFSRDGIEYGILAILKKNILAPPPPGEPEYYVSVPAQINNMLVGAGSMFSEDLREKWQALAQEFSVH
jgi:hypothetical protein